jgi:phosphomethylpyrimidine synthase
LLCTPKEHIGLPEIEDVRQGVVITNIAASIADIARGNKTAILRNKLMAKARKHLDWVEMSKYAIDRKKFREFVSESPRLKEDGCSMCGDDFCALKVYR